MRVLLAALAAALPIPHHALVAIDRKAMYRNFLPPKMLSGFTYYGWWDKGGIVRVQFSNRAGWMVEWRVQPMTGTCDDGKQQSFQLDGNKVWWAQQGGEQVAWRCVFDLAGKPLRLAAATSTPPSKLGASGLGVVTASAKRY